MNLKIFEFETLEQGMEKLKEAVAARNQMGGSLYWNIVNDDCLEIADRLYEMGGDKAEIVKILNS